MKHRRICENSPPSTKVITNTSPETSPVLMAIVSHKTSSQAPSYASPKLRLTESLAGVKCRATGVAKKSELK